VLAILLRPITAAKHNFYSIDILRGLSAIAILIFHYFHFLDGGGSMDLDDSLLQEVDTLNFLGLLRDHGSIAVMLFWTISGFVFMNVYAGLNPNFKTFWVNRFARLYPLHFVTLIIVSAIQLSALYIFGHHLVYDNNSVTQFILHIFLASEWFTPNAHSFNGPIWSVSIEIIIYAIFFLYVRLFPINLLTQVAALIGFGAAMVLIPDSTIPVCGAFFFGGMLCYSFFFFCPADYRSGILAAALTVFALMTTLYVGWGEHFPLPMTAWLLAIFTPLLLSLALSETIGLHRWYKRAHMVGDITYSTYLWHSPLQMLFLFGAGLGAWPLAWIRSDAFVIGYVVVVCVFSWFSFRYFERPAQGWIRARMLDRRHAMPLRQVPLMAAP
jgi:peptidoglycan/LPS O-acetylase OafA/YrhL